MSLITQIQSIGYCFLCGIIYSIVYCFINDFIVKIRFSYLRYSLYILFGLMFGCGYYYGLFLINNGIIRFYYIAFVLFGYILFCNYFANVTMNIAKKVNNKCSVVFSGIFGIIKRARGDCDKNKDG